MDIVSTPTPSSRIAGIFAVVLCVAAPFLVRIALAQSLYAGMLWAMLITGANVLLILVHWHDVSKNYHPGNFLRRFGMMLAFYALFVPTALVPFFPAPGGNLAKAYCIMLWLGFFVVPLVGAYLDRPALPKPPLESWRGSEYAVVDAGIPKAAVIIFILVGLPVSFFGLIGLALWAHIPSGLLVYVLAIPIFGVFGISSAQKWYKSKYTGTPYLWTTSSGIAVRNRLVLCWSTITRIDLNWVAGKGADVVIDGFQFVSTDRRVRGPISIRFNDMSLLFGDIQAHLRQFALDHGARLEPMSDYDIKMLTRYPRYTAEYHP